MDFISFIHYFSHCKYSFSFLMHKQFHFILHFFRISNFVIGQLRIIRISPFANRLSFDAPPAVQQLRCLANYQALRFSNPISTLGETLVARMKKLSANNSGKYISVHLRFEEVSWDGTGFSFYLNSRRKKSSLIIFFCRIWLLSLVVYMMVGRKKN